MKTESEVREDLIDEVINILKMYDIDIMLLDTLIRKVKELAK